MISFDETNSGTKSNSLVSFRLDIGTFVECLWNICFFTVLTLLVNTLFALTSYFSGHSAPQLISVFYAYVRGSSVLLKWQSQSYCPRRMFTLCAKRKVERQVKVRIKNLATFCLFPSKQFLPISLKIQLLVTLCNI
jgi:hypothetical protein